MTTSCNTAANSQCTFTCKQHFATDLRTSEVTLTCTDGTWDADLRKCEAIKCQPFALRDSHQHLNEYCTGTQPVASQCRIGCQANYRFSDAAFRDQSSITVSCQLDADRNTASWSRDPMETSCEEVKCRSKYVPVEKNYETLGCSEGHVDGSCRLTCKEGYIVASNLIEWTASCNFIANSISTAIWNLESAPVCEAIKCEPFALNRNHQYFIGHCTGTQPIASECRIGCRTNYRFSDPAFRDEWSMTVSCQLDAHQNTASWSKNPMETSCEEVKCRSKYVPVEKNYETLQCSEGKVGGSCRLTCKEGYRIAYNSIRSTASCNVITNNRSTAVWDVERAPVCGDITCERIDSRMKNVVVATCDRSIKGKCHISCRQFYKFASYWSSQDQVEATCSLSSNKLHAEWKTSDPRYPSYLQPIPQCVEILCPWTKLKGNYARATCVERSINSQCQIQCLNGFKFGNNKTEQNIICTFNEFEKTAFWPAPRCNPIIETRKNCQYWFSGTERRSETNAKKHCKDVLGENAALAILRQSDWIASLRLLEPRLVGAYVKKKGYWNDGVRIKGSFQNRGTCVSLDNAKKLIPSACDSKHMFICKKPPQGRNPCDDSKNCSGNGHCTPVGCSFLCKCQDIYYGRYCNKGPLTIGIAKTSIVGQYEIALKNDADNYTGVFYFLVNGKEERNVTLGPEDKEKFDYNLEKPVMKYETYLSVEASLLERPVTVSECKRIPGLESLTNITNDECNGHVLNVSWPGFVDDAQDSRPYSVYIMGKLIGRSRAGEWFQISELDPGRNTLVQVIPHVRGCDGLNIQKDYEKIITRTAKGPPDSPVVRAPKKAIGILPDQSCHINWTLNGKENAGGYKVKIVEFARSSKMANGNESIFNIHPTNDTYNFTTKPNSVYNISVGTVALPICPDVPVNWSPTVSGCTSETSEIKCATETLQDTDHYNVSYCPGDSKIGSSCSITCKAGYKLQTGTEMKEWKAICKKHSDGLSASWNLNLAPSCEVGCRSMNVPSDKNYHTRQCTDDVVGRSCLLTCKDGYRINSTSRQWNATCNVISNSVGRWDFDSAPSCQGHESTIEDRTNIRSVFYQTDSVALALTGIGAAIGMLILGTITYCLKKHLTRRRSAADTEDPSRLYELPIEEHQYEKIDLPISSTNAEGSNEQKKSVYETVNVSATSM